MARNTRLENAVLNVRTAMAFGRGGWRLRAGRLPWQRKRRLGRLRALSRR